MLVRTPRRPRLASPHKNGKCSVAHNAQAAVGFARKQTENSNNRRKVLSELKCPFTWELPSLRKENTLTLDSSSQGKPLLWAPWLGADRELHTARAQKLCFICIRLCLEIDWAGSEKLRAPQNANRLLAPWAEWEYSFLTHPLLWAWQVKWPGQWGRATESKTAI